jgi:DNA-binding NarL/FixJ family response regulator
MFNLTEKKYQPCETELKLLRMLANGYSQQYIARELQLRHCTLRKRLEKLRLDLGVNSTQQLMYHYGRYELMQELKNKAG